MAKDRKKLQHIHSSIPDKQPTAASLEVGEIAVNNAKDQEFLSIKNSNDNVVRFSSDEQIITWAEKKEVIPYSGTVENIHLDTNRSNIEIKLNQVVAHNTVKNDVVNGATDIDGDLVNPSSDGGLTNGAGFAIDTSAFALHGGNPEFSSITVTCRSELNGTTIIKGAGSCGSLLDINVNTENVTASTLNQSGNTYNVTANTENHNVTSFTVNSTTACVMSTDTAGIGGDLKTNVGTNCQGNPISNVTNVYGDTINNSGGTINTSATTINTTATTVNENVNNINMTGNTNSTGNANISGDVSINGDTYISGDITIGTQCSGLTSNTIADSFCEIIKRGVVTIEENHNPSDTNLAAVYTFYQNGNKLTNSAGTVVEIEVAKDKVLKSAEVVQNTSGEWVIRLTWLTYDPDTQTSTETTTDVPASELVKDIDAVDTPAVNLDIWYDTASGNQKISADTTITIAAAGGNKTFLKSNATHTLNAYKLNYNHNGFSGEFDPFTANSSFTSPHSALTATYEATSGKSGSVTYNTSGAQSISIPTSVSHLNRGTLSYSHNGASGTFDATSNVTLTSPHSALTVSFGSATGQTTSVSYDTSASKTITVPTAVSHINRGNLTVTHNGASSTYDPASASTIALSHSTLTATYGATSGQSGSVAYNTNGDKSITIPTCVNHLNRHTVKFQSGSVSAFTNQTYDPGNDCANSAETVYIPTSIDHLAEWNGTCFTIPHNLCVTGTITASQSIYSTSDERKKENIHFIQAKEAAVSRKVPFKSFNMISDPGRKLYGVIAQEVLAAGLDDLVHVDEQGYYSVDYTSLLILKIENLQNEVGELYEIIKDLKNKIDEKN